jgi:hypothetical protein
VADLAFPPPADDAPRISGMDAQPGTGVLFGSLNDGGASSSESYLATIDTTSGAVTIVGPTAAGLDALAWTITGVTVARDAMLCYKTKPSSAFASVEVSVADAFETSIATVSRPGTLCTPARVNGAALVDADTHLVGYRLGREAAHDKRQLRIGTALGVAVLETIKPDGLLVPAAKRLEPPAPLAPDPEEHAVDHFQCYKARHRDGLRSAAGQPVADQFQDRALDLKKITRLCAPADKDGEGVKDPAGFLLCYQAKPARGQPKHTPVAGIHTTDQFGSLELRTLKEGEVCVPAVVDALR